MKDDYENSNCSAFEVCNMPSQEYWITSFEAANLENKNVNLREVCFDGLDWFGSNQVQASLLTIYSNVWEVYYTLEGEVLFVERIDGQNLNLLDSVTGATVKLLFDLVMYEPLVLSLPGLTLCKKK